MATHDAMSLVKSQMLLKHVFFATLLLETPMVEWTAAECAVMAARNGGMATAATDMRRIFYNPKFMESLSKAVRLFVLAHEVMHIALKHGLRRGGRDAELWNIACDFAINLLLHAAKFEIWDKAYLHEFEGERVNFAGMSAEQIYPELLAILKKQQKTKAKGGKGGDLMGDLLEPNMNPDERAIVERRITQRVIQAATAARMCGQMKGELAQLVDGIVNPPLTWQELLYNYTTKFAEDEESWNHRNRRFEVYLPTRRSMKMGELVVIGDTSGSLTGSPIFAQTGHELETIREVVKPDRIRVIWADDDECNLEEVFEPHDEVVLHPTGGGGTDMRKPLKFIERYDPIVCVLVTDCYTPWPESPTPFPLIVLSNTNHKAPDWAMTIRI